MKKQIIVIGLSLMVNQAQASIMSLQEAQDRFQRVAGSEIQAKQEFLRAKANFIALKKAKKNCLKEIKAIQKANTASLEAERASIKYAGSANTYNPYLDAEILGSSTIRLIR